MPHCPICRKEIIENPVKWAGDKYHPSCFVKMILGDKK